MEKKTLCSAYVSSNGRILDFDSDDGYMGRLFNESKTVMLNVEIPRIRKAFCFSIDKRGVHERTPHNREKTADPLDIYKTYVPIRYKANSRTLGTTYPKNHIKICDIRDSGQFDIWEIGLISQRGTFFLVAQKSYEGVGLYKGGGGNILCPYFKDWQQLISIVARHTTPIGLPPVSLYNPPATINAGDLEGNVGRVIFFSEARGYGAVATPFGIAKAHYTQIKGRPRRSYLEKGERVLFERFDKSQEKEGGKLKNELFGVSVYSAF